MSDQAGRKQPNIVMVLADDMGFSDLGCYGGETRTPNIDSLAANGLRYTQAYNSARCCPSRASLMTGLHPHQAGIGWMTFGKLEGTSAPGSWTSMLEPNGPYQGFLNDSCSTIADVLGGAGYRTMLRGREARGSPPLSSVRSRCSCDTSPTRVRSVLGPFRGSGKLFPAQDLDGWRPHY
jgi:arylsulfatase A-like enzyme